MAKSQLNKQLWTNITRLKLLIKPDAEVRFLLEESPFDGIDDEEEITAAANLKEIVIVGRILPKSEIYREGAFRIEMKLKKSFPMDPPEVRFHTPIYHPNVGRDGKFCYDLLQKTAMWSRESLLVNIVRCVVHHIDRPDIDYSLSLELGREYLENRSVFNRKAMEYVKKHALPRF